jgi:zinc transport system permease protein
MSDFVIRAVLAGIGIALAAGPLGCFVVWRRMAYFGDTLSHAGLTGIALGLIAGVGPTAGMIAMGVALSLALFLLERQHRVPSDTILGILSHAALAIGLIAFAFLDRVRVDLLGYLFGDILAVTGADVVGIYIGAAIALLGLVAIWKPMVTLTVHADMAQAEGVPVDRVRFLFTLLVALSVAIAMKVVGILLVTAMLIVPAAAMRPLARGPGAMAVGSAVIGAIAVTGGMAASLAWDLPSGPAIVATAVVLFVLTAITDLVRARPNPV